MNFPRRARLKRINEILPRFPEAKELLLRYRAKLEAAEEKPDRNNPDPAPDRDRARVREESSDHHRPAPVPSRCPACDGPPGLSFVQEAPGTHGGARQLICASCERSWPFPRIVCPRCGEEETKKLPRFQAEEIPAVRIEACDTCQTYLKAIDLTRDARAVPAVDDLATCALDLAVRLRGYRRME